MKYASNHGGNVPPLPDLNIPYMLAIVEPFDPARFDRLTLLEASVVYDSVSHWHKEQMVRRLAAFDRSYKEAWDRRDYEYLDHLDADYDLLRFEVYDCELKVRHLQNRWGADRLIAVYALAGGQTQ